jgi:hypothetical protein
VNYQSATGLRCFGFSLGSVFAAEPGAAIAFAVEHDLMDQDAHSQLSLDVQAAYRALGGRAAREARQAETGAWMTRSVGPDDEAWDTAPSIIDPWPGPPGQPAGPEP